MIIPFGFQGTHENGAGGGGSLPDIAFDSSSVVSFANTTSRTFAHTIGSGSNTLLCVFIMGATSDNITGVTYNSVSLTRQGSARAGTDRYVFLYTLFNPSPGTNNIVISASSNGIAATALSYENVDTSGFDFVDIHTNVGITSSVSISQSHTDQTFIATFMRDSSGGITYTGTNNLLIRQNQTGWGGSAGDSDSLLSGTSSTISYTLSGNTSVYSIITLGIKKTTS